METAIEIITDTQIKRKIVGICDKAFMHGITIRKNYEEIFQKIDQNAVFIAAVIDKNYLDMLHFMLTIMKAGLLIFQ